MKQIIVLLAITFLALTGISYAQKTDALQGVKRTDGHFANFFRFEFKPGKTDEGLEIMNATLIPAFKGAGVGVTVMEDLMGAKDLLVLIDLQEGPKFYEYIVPAQDMRLFQELIKITGSEEEAEIQLDKFIGLLKRQSQTLVFIHDES